mmetsp:Transcript_12687/g.22701  ORF Transcript_12687/g.22701 Transcript_12687/m.22701 type:complete len:207 (+) Transcript_12687:293-913(+)
MARSLRTGALPLLQHRSADPVVLDDNRAAVGGYQEAARPDLVHGSLCADRHRLLHRDGCAGRAEWRGRERKSGVPIYGGDHRSRKNAVAVRQRCLRRTRLGAPLHLGHAGRAMDLVGRPCHRPPDALRALHRLQLRTAGAAGVPPHARRASKAGGQRQASHGGVKYTLAANITTGVIITVRARANIKVNHSLLRRGHVALHAGEKV